MHSEPVDASAGRPPKTIVLVPAYNEAEGLVDLLDRTAPHVDSFIIVDDCSTDSTVAKIKAWRKGRRAVHLITLPTNVGASGALKAGYLYVIHLLKTGAASPDDLVIEMDSDGQHDPKYIPQLRQPFLDGRPVDVVLGRRDFSNYPRYKRMGNLGLTLAARLLSGYSYDDVESNFRVTRARVFAHLLEYFSGYRYSGAFEVGIILASLKYRIQNDVTIKVPFYTEGARATDGFYVMAMGLKAWVKVRLGLKNRDVSPQVDAVLNLLSEV